MDSLLSDERINSGRQIEWDVAKVFAIVLMIMVHFFAFCSFGTLDYGIITEYLFILAQCSAPIFMFAMGVGMVYTRHDSSREFIVRGIKLLLLGLVVNTMYFLSNYGAGVPLDYSLLSFLANDILQFAGISFIIIGILKRFDFSTVKMLVISILFSLIVSYFPDFASSNIYLTQFLGNIIETSGQNIVGCFPVFNWLIIPVSGMLFAEDLIRCKDKYAFYEKIYGITALMVIILLITGFITREGMFSTVGGTVPEKLGYLHGSLPDMVILVVIILFLVSVFYFLSRKFPLKVENFFIRTIRNVTAIYLIQWAIILSLTYINQFLGVEATLPIAIITLLFVIVASITLAEAYVKIKGYVVKN